MSNKNILEEKISIEKDIVFEFVLVYSRFEYALKRSGTYAVSHNGKVSANIYKYADDKSDKFSELEKNDLLKESINYLDSNPPSKQVLCEDGQLDWDPIEWEKDNGESRLRWLVRAVQTARNNLFHGGKFRDGRVEDPSRDPKLLECGITLIRHCVTLEEGVNKHFCEF